MVSFSLMFEFLIQSCIKYRNLQIITVHVHTDYAHSISSNLNEFLNNILHSCRRSCQFPTIIRTVNVITTKYKCPQTYIPFNTSGHIKKMAACSSE